ncbi:glycosyltransferase [Cytophagales bacterium LB-30]|uniref:Glycosyltransferase n=1 Tax=Shiella aurantiaca TaxID=3058365 RepID=A0ABT8F9B9_9BACT|nr:glycosyltransferase [Shiella aurantiaca]MDN4166551.1 glycosyltransferase [Shiella aurantiaca]
MILLYIFLSSSAILLFYYGFYFARIAFYSRKKQASDRPEGVSVIVCAHDEEENLKHLLPRLYEQEYPEFEIIIVNDRSNDGTYDLLREESKNQPLLKPVHVEHTPEHINGKKYGITLGVKAAKYDLLLFTDADCFPASKQWISEMASEVTDKTQFVLGFSPYEKKSGFLNLFIRFETLLTAFQYLSFGLAKSPYMGVGRNMAYRKSFFLAQKGFNHMQHIMGGDDDLFVNLHAKGNNTQVVIGEKSMVYSIPKKTWSEYFVQKKRHLAVGKLYRFRDKLRLGIFQLATLLHWVSAVGFTVIVQDWYILGATLFVKWTVWLSIWAVGTKKMGTRFPWGFLPILEFVYCLYFLVFGTTALFAKKIKWK